MSTGNVVQVFEGEGFGKVRVVKEGDKPFFVAKDIVEALGQTWDGHRIDHVPSEWKLMVSVTTSFGTKETNCLTEEGVNFFVIRSDSPKALPVQKWLAGTVMPELRRGNLVSMEALMNDPRWIAARMLELADARDKVKEAEQTLLKAAPLIAIGERVQQLDGEMTVGEYSKFVKGKTKFKIGRNILFEWLAKHGYIFRNHNNHWEPKGRYTNQGLFRLTHKIIQKGFYSERVPVIYITTKGQSYFLPILLTTLGAEEDI
jgi:prophage antirepressor-like protein